MTIPTPAPSPSGVVEFSMTPEARARTLKMNVGFTLFFVMLWFGLGALNFAIGNVPIGSMYIAIAALSIVGTLVLARRMVERSRIIIGDGAVTMRGMFRDRRIEAHELAQVVTVNDVGLGMAPGAPILLLVGHTRRLGIFTGHMWGIDQLGAVANDLASRGVQLLSYQQRITPHQLRAMDRRWMPFRQAHPVIVSLLIGVGLILFFIIAFVILVAILTAN